MQTRRYRVVVSGTEFFLDVVQTGGGFVWRKSFQKFKDLFKNKNREERRAAKALKEAEEARRDE